VCRINRSLSLVGFIPELQLSCRLDGEDYGLWIMTYDRQRLSPPDIVARLAGQLVNCQHMEVLCAYYRLLTIDWSRTPYTEQQLTGRLGTLAYNIQQRLTRRLHHSTSAGVDDEPLITISYYTLHITLLLINLSLITYYSLLITHYSLLITHYSLLITHDS
jgi:hypothetical protein